MTDNSTIIQYLRDTAFADGAILLDDLQLGKLGIAMPSMVDRLKQRKSDWSWPAPNGSRLAMIKQDRKSTRLNSSHIQKSRMPSSA